MSGSSSTIWLILKLVEIFSQKSTSMFCNEDCKFGRGRAFEDMFPMKAWPDSGSYLILEDAAFQIRDLPWEITVSITVKWRVPQCLCHPLPHHSPGVWEERMQLPQNHSTGSAGSWPEGGRWHRGQITQEKGSCPGEPPTGVQLQTSPQQAKSTKPVPSSASPPLLKQKRLPLSKAGC